MTTPAAVARDALGVARPISTPERRQRRRAQLAWALLVLNVLTFYPGMALVVPIPSALGRIVPQLALVAALVLALSARRPVAVRPTVFLAILTLLPLEALITSMRAEFVFGAVFRASRLSAFVAVLWLLTPWWDRRGMVLVKAHLAAVWAVLGLVAVGVVLAPGMAFPDGRLAGTLWPIPPTQIGHYAAIVAGMAMILWLSGLLRRGLALGAVGVAVPMLLLTHTRTALIAMVAGVLIGGLSLFTSRSRVRRTFVVGSAIGVVGVLAAGSVVLSWLARGQDAQQVSQLTGRTKVWDAILAEPRTTYETLFGFGLSNKSYNGLPIDSNWLATYHDLGLVGVAVNVSLLVFVLVAAGFRPQGPRRALALFLATYCFVASFTETGLSDASPYFLEHTLAASLLVSAAPRRRAP